MNDLNNSTPYMLYITTNIIFFLRRSNWIDLGMERLGALTVGTQGKLQNKSI